MNNMNSKYRTKDYLKTQECLDFNNKLSRNQM